MRRSLVVLALLSSTLTLVSPVRLAAQTTISARAATITLGGRLHTQYQASSVAAGENDFFIRRARLNADLVFNDFFSGKVLTDFAGGTATLLDAYVELDFDPRFRFLAGQFKRAFDLFELVSSTDLALIERDGRVDGYAECTGVGSICSYSRLTEELAFAGRDVGARVEGGAGGFGYMATLTNGTGVGERDENDGKSLSGRASFEVSEGVVVAGNVGLRDYVAPDTERSYAVAWGGDLQVGTWRDGLMLQAGLVGGENWMSLDPVTDDPGRFVTMQAVATYYYPVRSDRFAAVEPLARVSWADPDGDVADDGGTLLTPGMMVYLLGKNRIGVNLDAYLPQDGDTVYSLKLQAFLYF